MTTNTPTSSKRKRSIRYYVRARRSKDGMAAKSDYGSDVDLAELQSNYGSDFDSDGEAAVDELLATLEAKSGEPLILENLEFEEDDASKGYVLLPAAGSTHKGEFGEEEVEWELAGGMEVDGERAATEDSAVKYPELDGKFTTDGGTQTVLEGQSPQPESQREKTPDTRSPLERFRTAPKKPLSVTDIVSPAWCELQYWYTLTKHGRKKRTPAMKQGSKVHKVLEEQVHQVVPVEVQTREDGWGLKIWNVIQGLRTLRVTGMTRELEVWGVIDGQVINGIIDELSFRPPSSSSSEDNDTPEGKKPSASQSEPGQKTISEFFNAGLDSIGFPLSSQKRHKKLYLTDVKTRGSKYLPQGTSLLPTWYQLMLYHRLLSNLSSNAVTAQTIFDRYRLDASAPFSDAFIAEIGGLDFNFHTDSDSADYAFENDKDAVTELLAHNNLAALWSLMILEFSRTIPSPGSIADVLTAEFRSQKDGTVLGSKTFTVDEKILDSYVGSEMAWWKGEREAKGVDIEDAFKCRICEFADECTWRKAKVDEGVERYRARTGRTGEGTHSVTPG